MHHHPTITHPMFAAVFAKWLDDADALSALPDAPVVPDEPRPGPVRRAAAWPFRNVGRMRSLAGSRIRSTQTQSNLAPACARGRAA